MTPGGLIDILITLFLAVRRFGLRRTIYASILLSPAYIYSLPPVSCGCIRPFFRRCAPFQRPYQAWVKSDLKNLASQQEIYWSDNETYSADLQELGFVASDGVRLTVEAGPDSWSARATHDALGNQMACAIYWGETPPAELGLDEDVVAGEIVCTE
jgi:hypothetical protein